MTNILFFDIETTGLPPKGAKYDTDFNLFPHIVQISWWYNDNFNDYIIKPDGYEIPQFSTEIHGVTNEMAIEKGVLLKEMIDKFINDCFFAEKLVGHNLFFDTSIIKANIYRLLDVELIEHATEALHKSKRIDTMYKSMKFVGARQTNGAGKTPTLLELHRKLFGESFPAHNSLEDVKATMRCFYELKNRGLIKI